MRLLKGFTSRLARTSSLVLAAATVALGSATIPSTPAAAVAPAATATATAVSRSAIVAAATSQLNNATRNAESPMGSGCNYYTGYFRDWKSGVGCPSRDGVQWRDSDWCADFSKYVWRSAGVPHADVPEGGPLGTLTGWARSFKEYGVEHGTWHTRAGGYTPQPGDAVVFDWDQSGDIDHVGIVSSSNADTVYTIEGNSGDRIKSNSYARSNVDIVGYTAPVGASQVGGKASVYGVLADGRLTYNLIDAATGAWTTVRSTATLGFTPKAMATLNFNTLLVTEADSGGKLYRVDIQDNNGQLTFNPPVYLAQGYTHELLAFDGNTHLFGIAAGVLKRYNVNAAKPTAATISTGTKIGPNDGTGFTLKTLTATAPNWILGTTTGGALISYRITADGADYTRHLLRESTWQVFDHLVSPGGGLYLAHHTNGHLYRYTDADPHDGNADDLTNHGVLNDEGGWTQILMSAQPGTVS